MSRGVLFSTFFILAVGVILSLLFAYKYVKNPKLQKNKSQQTQNITDLESDTIKTSIEKSWLKDIDKKRDSRSYIYAYRQIQIKLND